MQTIESKLASLKMLISQYEKLYQRIPGSVRLLAVTKTHPITTIQAAINAGQRVFGENYLQEALPKIEHFKEHNLEWHFIGKVQSNKTKKIAEHFAWVHSVESSKIAKRLNDHRPEHLPPLNICLEININDETNKAGTSVSEIYKLANYCSSLPRIKLRGLMTVPPIKTTLAEQRIEYNKLKMLFNDLRSHHLNLDTLSMGMTQDLEAAIAEGATIVRIGTALFGKRDK